MYVHVAVIESRLVYIVNSRRQYAHVHRQCFSFLHAYNRNSHSIHFCSFAYLLTCYTLHICTLEQQLFGTCCRNRNSRNCNSTATTVCACGLHALYTRIWQSSDVQKSAKKNVADHYYSHRYTYLNGRWCAGEQQVRQPATSGTQHG